MLQQRSLSRRQVLQYTGITASSTLLAGCSNQGDGSDDGNENGNGTAPDGSSANEDGENESEPNNESSNETNNGGNESNESGSNTAEWQDVDEIVLDGYTEGWEGVEPEPIAGEQNPTVTLIEGQEYDFTWENADGQPHNIAIWDSNDEAVVEATDLIDSEGETQTLTVEASEEMAAYVCEVHPQTMIANIQIESGNS